MTDSPLLLAIDQGTSSSRAILFTADGKSLASEQKELTLFYPQKGWVEQDPTAIWADTRTVCRAVMERAGAEDAARIAAVGITNQRETTILWHRATGKPVYNAIVWQDRRTADLCEKLKAQGHEPDVRARTGLLLDPYFSATKIAWILDNVDGARAAADAGDLAFGTVDSWLLWNLTGGAVHATDATNAARTLLCDIRTGRWDDTLCALFGIPSAILPEIRDTAAAFGVTADGVLPRALPVCAMAGDQHAALAGQACFEPGMVKATYGTGCFALMNAGPEFRESQNRLLTTPAWRLAGETTYAIEGSIFSAGTAVQWLRDGLGLIAQAADSEKLALSVPDSNGVYLVPAFTGLGAPWWDPHARASITGLSRESTAAHIVRAALEAQAYQTLDLMDAMAADTGQNSAVLRADGGLVANTFVCEFLAAMLDRPVEIPETPETTALGAAFLAGLQAGVYKDLSAITPHWRRAARYEPAMDAADRESRYAGWKDAVRRTLSGP